MESKVEQLGKVCFTVDKEYHNINRDYDKLVIVESYENKATYASRKPVPKGTSLNDREYWIKFSSLAEHIEQNYNVIQQELNELYNKVGIGINFYGDYSTFDFNSSKTIILNFNTVNSFEKASVVKLYQNDTLMDTYTNISEFTKEVTVSSEVTFKVIAKIGNYTFAATWEVTTAYNWYIGGGATYQSMMIDSNKHSGTEEPISSVQTITVNNTGDYIFICVQKNMILPEITMGGFPIPFDDPYNAIVDGVEYNIYKSSNSYKVGTYVIKLGAVTWDNDDVLKNLLASITGFSATEQELNERLTIVEQIVGDYNPGGSHRTPEVIPTVDEEDLTIGDDNVFKFKNRPNTDGMGMIILRKDKTFAEQLTQTNTIYIIQYDFDLNEESVTILENSVLKFDGGTIYNGTIIGDNTRLIYDKPIDEVCLAERQGTFIYNTTVVDEEDITSESGQLKFKDRPATDGMGRKILRKNIVDGVNTLTQSMINQSNTIYIIQYDFTLGEDITVPDNCVLEFEGGSLSNGSFVNPINIVSSNQEILKNVSFTSIHPIEVEWIGVNTSNADNSAKLNAFINSIESENSVTFLFSKGTYNFLAPINLRSGINFIGKEALNRALVSSEISLDGQSIIKFSGDHYGIIKNEEFAHCKFQNIVFVGENGAGGIDFRDINVSIDITFKECGFYGFKNKCAVILNKSWSVIFDDCWFNACGCAVYFDNSNGASCNNISFISPNIGDCCIGIFCNANTIYGLNIFGGTIQDIGIGRKGTSVPTEFSISATVLNELGVSSVSEVSGVVVFIGTCVFNSYGTYFEKCENFFYFGDNSEVNVMGSYINSDTGGYTPTYIFNCYKVRNLSIRGCRFILHANTDSVFNINSKRTHCILGNSYNSPNSVYSGNLYSDTGNGFVFKYYSVLENTNFGILAFPTMEKLYLDNRVIFRNNSDIIMESVNDSTTNAFRVQNSNGEIRMFYNGNACPYPTPDGGIFLPQKTNEPESPKVGIYLVNSNRWDPLNKGAGKTYLVVWNGTAWVDVTGATV